MGNFGSSKQQQEPCSTEDRIRGAIYGNCVGDAIGLATQTLTKDGVGMYYGGVKHWEYEVIMIDKHREQWQKGDWTDDSDEMVLTMMSVLDNEGKTDPLDFASKLHEWRENGFPDLGDESAVGICLTTSQVSKQPNFLSEPHKEAESILDLEGERAVDNGPLKRVTVLGINECWNIDKVIENTLVICGVTHAEPRCKASCVAVATCIAFMLQEQPKHVKDGKLDISSITVASYEYAKKHLTDDAQVAKLKKYMFAESLSDLELADETYAHNPFKAIGAGFWALRQTRFRDAIEDIIKEAGDADTNCAVAGALLGCKLGPTALPSSWLNGLKHKAWLDEKLDRFVVLVKNSSQEQEPETTEKEVAEENTES